jgi:hypothetical protein
VKQRTPVKRQFGHRARLALSPAQVSRTDDQAHAARTLWNLLHAWWRMMPTEKRTLANADAAIRRARQEIDFLAVLQEPGLRLVGQRRPQRGPERPASVPDGPRAHPDCRKGSRQARQARQARCRKVSRNLPASAGRALQYSVMRPHWGDLERPGRAPAVWRRAQSTFHSKVLGPHFETLCHAWARWYACDETYDGQPSRVAAGTVNDPAARTSHEVDIAVFGHDTQDRESLLAIGESKWNDIMGIGHLQRLQHLRGLLAARGTAEQRTPRLMCFSGAGFTDELRRIAADDRSVQLVDLERLYHGE